MRPSPTFSVTCNSLQTDFNVKDLGWFCSSRVSFLSSALLQHYPSKLHSENKHVKSCLFVVLLTDLTKQEFRLSANLHLLIRLLRLILILILIKSQQNLFILGSYCCSKRTLLTSTNNQCFRQSFENKTKYKYIITYENFTRNSNLAFM